MKAIGFKNLRSLEDTGLIELRPINILVGKNNSGKSTFLRSFPLLRQSVESRIIGPILWYGNYVDFGSFKEALYDRAKERQISLLFSFSIDQFTLTRAGGIPFRYFMSRMHANNRKELDIRLTINISEGTKSSSLVNSIAIAIEDSSIQLELDSKSVTSILINGIDYSSIMGDLFINPSSQGFLPRIMSSEGKRSSFDEREVFLILIHELRKYHSVQTGNDRIIDLLFDIPLGSSTQILKAMKNFEGCTKTWEKNVEHWGINSDEFIGLRNLVVLLYLDSIIQSINLYLEQFSEKIRYIAPIRASAERYYRWQNLALDEIDFRGQNLAMFLSNLTVKEKSDFEKWTNNLFGLRFITSGRSEQLSIKVKDSVIDEIRNLTDTGFGYSQMLPVLTQLWFLEKSRRTEIYKSKTLSRFYSGIPIVFAIEQPELHLHPGMQSKLVDAFIDTINRGKEKEKDIRLIIETHSEVIINKLGHMIFEGNIKPNDVNVIVFERNIEERRTDIRIAKFNDEGYLTDWPIGFFEPQA